MHYIGKHDFDMLVFSESVLSCFIFTFAKDIVSAYIVTMAMHYYISIA